LTQKEAVLDILSDRKTGLTLEELASQVAKKTKRTATVGSMNVVLSHLRSDGCDVVRTTSKAGITRYLIAG